MNVTQKKWYEAPSIEVIAMENEGVIAASGDPGGGSTSESVVPSPFGSSNACGASSSDLEDMINDILTFE